MTLNELAVILGGIALAILALASRLGNTAEQRYKSCNTGRLTIDQLKQHGVKDVRNN